MATRSEVQIGPSGGEPMNPAECRLFLRLIGYRNYQDYLYSPLWFEIRTKVMKKAGKRCEYCGCRAVQVHHEIYTRENLYGVTLFGLYAVCVHCHELRHGLT
jgi:hypothetical protein